MMEPTIWDKIASTPWWIGFFYFFMILTGYQATKPRQAPYKGMRNTAIIFFLFTTISLVAVKLYSATNIIYWSAMLTSGVLLGWLQYRVTRIQLVPGTDLIQFRGNWFSLIVVAGLIYLYSRYGLNDVINLDLIHNQTFLKWLPAAYGLFAGLMIGKVIYLRRLLTA